MSTIDTQTKATTDIVDFVTPFISISTDIRVTRSFTIENQRSFADLSGDYNPGYVDPKVARRLMFGQPVVHGIHSFLWSLDCWLSQQVAPQQLTKVRVVFHKPIGVGQQVEFKLARQVGDQIELELWCQGALATAVRFTSQTLVELNSVSEIEFWDDTCTECLPEDYEGAKGELPIALNNRLLGELLPNVAVKLDPRQVAQILASTRLVGMHYPGLHSLYSELDFELDVESDVKNEVLNFEVTRFDPRFSMLQLALSGQAFVGKIKSFVRPEPQQQPTFEELKTLVSENEFVGQRALIIGGSRGLGEVTAKLLAAGGAEVVVTYHRGASDAQALVGEIEAGQGTADSAAWNVLEPQNLAPQNFGNQWQPTHLYYCATPFIATSVSGQFRPDLFQKFSTYYIDGFLATLEAVDSDELTDVIYPSSVFVEQLPPNLGEYSVAKAAGEGLCQFLNKTRPNTNIHAPRLPKMATDQTASFLPSKRDEPAPVMLSMLRDLTTESE
jgi:acyl dehydratase/NADP-dependent 3-hydroxy acid dehydrogenase YdfG